jgi:cell division protein FtsL
MTSRLGIVSLALALLAAAGLFTLKDQVRRLESRLADVRSSLASERREIGRLRAEWAILEEPERLARLAAEHLQLQPAQPGQIVDIDQIPLRADLEFAGRRMQVLLPSGAETTLRLKPLSLLAAPWRRTVVAAAGRQQAAEGRP